MAAPTVYRSSDASAPTITSTKGTLVTALDAILVNGYGSQSAAGWTIAQTTTNKRDYQQGGASNKMILSVNDDGPGTAVGQEARFTGFVTSTGLGTGTGQFPAANLFIRKSVEATGGSTTRQWVCIADTRTVYMFIFTVDTPGTALAFGFGDIYSYASGDTLKCGIWGRTTEASGTASVDSLDKLAASFAAIGGNYLASSYTGLGGPINSGKIGDSGKGSATTLSGSVGFPNAPDGGLYLSRVFVLEPTGAYVRGYMRGFYHLLHAISNVNDGDTFSGSGYYAGRTFMVVKQSGNSGAYVIETTAWDTST